jgi:heterodisulfide reductase subunit A-like polyferredoxin
MSKRKIPSSSFVLREENGVVEASLNDENDLSLKHTVHDMPHPRVIAPRRSKAQIEEDSRFLAACSPDSHEAFLRKNIAGMNQEINKQIQEIRKSLKRMQSYAHYMVRAEEILRELEQTHNK